MRAIIETGGKQFAVSPAATIRVPSLDGRPGDEVTFDRVLYVSGDDAVHVGSPAVDGASVTAEIVKHGRGEKIRVFRMKRRKRYRRTTGHRQDFTELRITGVSVGDRTVAAPESKAAAEADAFECDVCGKTFESERGLKTHKTRSHSE